MYFVWNIFFETNLWKRYISPHSSPMTSSTSPQCLVVWSSPQITASLCSDTSLGSTPTLISLKLSISVPVAPGYQIIWIKEELFSANYLNTSVSWSTAPVSRKVLFYPCWTQSSSLSHSLRPDQSVTDWLLTRESKVEKQTSEARDISASQPRYLLIHLSVIFWCYQTESIVQVFSNNDDAKRTISKAKSMLSLRKDKLKQILSLK